MTAFAILCHGEPERLSHLLRVLEGFDVFVHIDKFADRGEIYSSISHNNLSRVQIISETESIRGSWGGYSIVEIQLRLIQEFLSHTSCEGPLVFLSGQDFPIKPLNEFAKYMNTKENFFSIQKLDNSKIAQGDSREVDRLLRIKNLHFQDFRFFHHCKDRNSLKYKLGSIPSALLRRMKISNPNFNKTRQYFIGSQWVAISRLNCELLFQNRDSLRSEFKYTFCPDEIAFQTFYGRLQDLESTENFANEETFDSVIDADFHLIHPSLNHNWNLSESDLISDSSKFFIRKPSFELLNKLQTSQLSN